MSRKSVHETCDTIQKIKGVLNGLSHTGRFINGGDEGEYAEWILNLCTWELTSPCGTVIPLTHNELRFLKLLSQTPSNPVNRHEIMADLFSRCDLYTNRSLDSLVRRLRLKIQATAVSVIPIKTAHSIGYAFSAPLIVRS